MPHYTFLTSSSLSFPDREPRIGYRQLSSGKSFGFTAAVRLFYKTAKGPAGSYSQSSLKALHPALVESRNR